MVTLFLSGDVMSGRGIDQVLPCPGDPGLRERFVDDARTYVRLAESASGPVSPPGEMTWPWGAALEVLDEVDPQVRIVNLETSITRCPEFAADKGIHYRMSPDNIPFLLALRPSACALANNHVLDFGPQGLRDTLDALAGAGLAAAGAEVDLRAARAPVAVPVADGGRVLVFSCGLASSGIPPHWAATVDRPGVWLLPALTDAAADRLTHEVNAVRRPDDLVVVSIHWGPNWGYEVSDEERRFAHRLVDAGVDVVHGHSSHHPRPVEIFRDRLVLYGCGDFVNDYEGIPHRPELRSDLRPMFLPTLDAATGALKGLRIVLLRSRGLRLERASDADVGWFQATLDEVSRPFGTRISRGADGLVDVAPSWP